MSDLKSTPKIIDREIAKNTDKNKQDSEEIDEDYSEEEEEEVDDGVPEVVDEGDGDGDGDGGVRDGAVLNVEESGVSVFEEKGGPSLELLDREANSRKRSRRRKEEQPEQQDDDGGKVVKNKDLLDMQEVNRTGNQLSESKKSAAEIKKMFETELKLDFTKVPAI